MVVDIQARLIGLYLLVTRRTQEDLDDYWYSYRRDARRNLAYILSYDDTLHFIETLL
jgi:hypothetical protein